MAQSYTRQSTFADGDTITASLFNNEYNQLENSFSYSSSNSSITGHRHDGTAGQGGNIFKIGDLDFLNKIEVDGTSNRWGVYVEVGGVSTEQIRVQDGSIVPVTNNDIDLGTPSLEFKDLFIDGTAHIDTLDIDENATVAGTLGVTGATTLSSTLAVTGTSTLTGNVTATNDLSIGGNLTVTGNATINGNLTFGDADTDSINLAAEIDSNIVPNTDNTYDLGTATKEWRNLYINGTANIDSLVADTADINGGTIDGATIATSDINGGTIDGVTIATSDITVGAAKTLDVSAGTLILADDQISGDKVEGGTINATTINTLTYGSLSDGVITVTAFVDEDDMVSNSATLVPTQQSVKTYVDTLVAATNEVVEDATPQLGGDLDLNSNNITGTGNINITGTIQSSGNITGTLATAAQGNVTSLGTLTSLDVSGDLTVDTNTLKVDSTTNRVGILNVSPDVSLDIGSATDAVHVPVGTTAQRPGTPAAGYFRYNADLEQFEGYTDTWGAIGGGGTNTFTYDTYTGDGVTTNFVLSQATNLEGNLIVFIDGVFQTQDAYTISTASGITTLIFSAAPANTRKIVVYTIAAGVSGNNLNLDSFSGDGVLTDFTLSINAISENNTQVYIDGVYQQKDGYTVTNTTLSFSAPPLNGSTIEVMTFTQTEVNVPVDNTITSAKLSGDLVTPGNLDVTGSVTADGLTVDGDASATGVITISNGSYAAPAIAFASDTDTGIARGGTNTLGFVSGGVLRFYTDPSSALATVSLGTSNLTLGVNAGNSIVSGGDYNVLVGDEAGASLTTPNHNVAVGYSALTADTQGTGSVAIGRFALGSQNFTSATDVYNTAVGFNAGVSVSTGIQNTLIGGLAGDANTTASNNTAVGHTALGANTTGERLTAIGQSALAANTTAAYNVAVGDRALLTNTGSANNVAVGANALYTFNVASGDGYNVAVGKNAGFAVTTGTFNTLVGGLAGDALTDADYNVAFGYNALSGDTRGSRSIAIGVSALANQNFTSATDVYNTAVGHGAGSSVTTGISNTLIGGLAGGYITTGTSNSTFGYNTLARNTEGANNTAVGADALFSNTTASDNTAVGKSALLLNTTGDRNVAMGALALDANTIADGNTAVGYDSLSTNTGSELNVAMGFNALRLYNNVSGSGYNTAVGALAGAALQNGTQNTLIGATAGDLMTTGNSNTSVGYFSMSNAVVTGNDNTAVGKSAGYNLTSGSNNLLLGHDAGFTGSPGGNITTQSNNICLGDENIVAIYAQVQVISSSDMRDKTDFTPLDLGLDFVKALAPVTYKWDKRSKYGDKTAEDYDLNAQTPDGTHKEAWLDIGFKAQEVIALEEAAGYTIADKTNLVSNLSEDGKQYGLQYENFVPILVKAIQELSAQNAALTARIEALES